MSYIDDLEQAAAEALAASSSATDSAQIMADVANGDENTTVTTANGEVKTLAKAIKDIIDTIEAGVEAPQVEPQTLSAGQTTVTLSTMTTEGIAVYVEGSREFDFTVVNSTDFEFGESFPDGTRIWIVKRDIEGTADSFTVNTSTGTQTLVNALDNRVIYVDTIADLQALDTSGLVDGQGLKITTTGRAGDFVVRVGDFSTEVANDPQSGVWVPFQDDPDGDSFVAKRLHNRTIRAEWFGFEENGTHAVNKAALQAAINYTPGTVSLGDYPNGVNCGSGIQTKRGLTIEMSSTYSGGAASGGLIGDGVDAIFITGSYTIGGPNTPSLIREITFRRLSATNTGGFPVVKLHSSPNSTFEMCRFFSTDAPTVDARFSFRLSILGGKYNSGFSSAGNDNFALTFYDNCNGLYIRPDTVISGGSNGGGVDVALSQKLYIDGIYESCGAANAVRVGGPNNVATGSCRAVRVGGYYESCNDPFNFGETSVVTAMEIGAIYLGNNNISNPPNYAIQVGRVNGMQSLGTVTAIGEGTEVFLKAINPPGSGIVSPERIYLDADITGFSSSVDVSALTAPLVSKAFNQGKIAIGGDVLSGLSREYVSPTITTDSGFPISAFDTVLETSGIIDSVELLEVDGDLSGCSLSLGYPGNISFNMDYDLSGASISSRYSDITAQLSATWLRQNELFTMRITSGTGTGTFRVKIKYRI